MRSVAPVRAASILMRFAEDGTYAKLTEELARGRVTIDASFIDTVEFFFSRSPSVFQEAS
jgi:hypothetical protein